jgi:GAF domain-containing protein
MQGDHLEDLRAQARLARERYQLYKARTFGQRPTSEERLRELQRAYEQAEERRRFAEAEELRARSSGQHRQDPS